MNSSGELCVACARDLAVGRRNAFAGIPELDNGVCPECGGTRGMATNDLNAELLKTHELPS